MSKTVTCIECSGTGKSETAYAEYEYWHGYRPFVPKTPYSTEHPIILEQALRNVMQKSMVGAQWSVPNGVKADGKETTVFSKDVPEVVRERERLTQKYNSQRQYHLDDTDVLALWDAGRLWHITSTLINGQWVLKDMYINTPPARDLVNNWAMVDPIGHDSLNCSIVANSVCAFLKQEAKCPCCNGEGYILGLDDDSGSPVMSSVSNVKTDRG